jgi:RNA polymerase sigma-70 factor (ECF subfamily)
VTTTAPTGDSPDDSPPATLGELLYADKAKARVPEALWVALVSSIAAGDQLALQELYERSHRIVFTLIMRTVNNRETAEELTLDVFHDVWLRAPAYDAANGTVVGWIMNQARSRAIDRLRFEQRKKRVNAHPDELAIEPAAEGPQEALDLSQQAQVLRTALQTLTPVERAAIETAFFGECAYAEVAAKLNQPVGTVKTRIRSGLMKLRRALVRQENGP